MDARTYNLHWVLSFTDNWPPQLLQIKKFLENEGVSVGSVRHTGQGGHKIEVAAIDSLKKCAIAMLHSNCMFKKRGEIQLMLDYFDGKITGVEVASFLNEEVRVGLRVGKMRQFNVPYSYSGRGYTQYKTPPSGKPLTEEQKSAIVRDYTISGMTMYELAASYRVSPSKIFRLVRGLKRGPIVEDKR